MVITLVSSKMSSTFTVMLVMSIIIMIQIAFFTLKLLILIWDEWKRFGFILINNLVKIDFSHISVTVIFDVLHDIFHSVALVFKSKDNQRKWNKKYNGFSEQSVSSLRFVDRSSSLTEFSNDQNKKRVEKHHNHHVFVDIVKFKLNLTQTLVGMILVKRCNWSKFRLISFFWWLPAILCHLDQPLRCLESSDNSVQSLA